MFSMFNLQSNKYQICQRRLTRFPGLFFFFNHDHARHGPSSCSEAIVHERVFCLFINGG